MILFVLFSVLQFFNIILQIISSNFKLSSVPFLLLLIVFALYFNKKYKAGVSLLFSGEEVKDIRASDFSEIDNNLDEEDKNI